MLDFEKLGAFYLGKRVDAGNGDLTDDLVLYDSKDLTTHAVIIGMTGSGKTGLGIGLLEEAAMDHIPVIAIDPKGDMGNLKLTFPDFAAKDFEPWVNARQASDEGITTTELAASQAQLWKSGLAKWGQDGARISSLRANAEVRIYTPGSSAGLPVSVLQSFAAPGAELLADTDLYRDSVQATATGLLSLLDIDADPIASREHILLSHILDHAWQQQKDLDIADLIAAIQKPPVQKIGVMDVDTVYPAKDRFQLAMRLNNLLAAPGFVAWLQGEPLRASNLLYDGNGKPRISVMSIAHLDDAQRMFFVSMLLNEIIGWMRGQQGTSSLRAILYMDEIFGYLPPTANPPSKRLFLTLLKQARAYGLGLVLATQNPVDLDYKALSNTGTWFIGRLQTERDKARVMEGLEGVRSDGFDKQKMEQTLAGLGKRRFLLHSVHEDEAVVFNTRWAMSYLAGPLTREQISKLSAADVALQAAAKTPMAGKVGNGNEGDAPVLAPSIRQLYVAARAAGIVYYPRVIGSADIAFASSRHRIDVQRSCSFTAEIDEGPVPLNWNESEALDLAFDELTDSGYTGARYAECPRAATLEKNFATWETDFRQWLRKSQAVRLYESKRFKLVSGSDESEGEFRIRLQQLASEQRDNEVAKLRKRYAGKATTLDNRLLRAEQAIDREQQQSSKKKLDTVVSVGTAILGALLGRKRLSSTSASRVGTAIKTASGARKEAADVARAEETAAKVRAELEALNARLEKEVDALDTAFDAQSESLEELLVRAKASDIQVNFVGLVWMPYAKNSDGRLSAAWNARERPA
jgi:hypothetical protein